MFELIKIYLGRIVSNYIGATVRWTYGTIWRTILNKPKYTYAEYVNGPKDSEDSFDQIGHKLNNRIIGMIAVVLIIGLITFLNLRLKKVVRIFWILNLKGKTN